MENKNEFETPSSGPLQDARRAFILRVLFETGWVILVLKYVFNFDVI